MAYAFSTESGSFYKVEDGVLSRVGGTEVIDRHTGARVPYSDKFEVRVRVVSPPEVGRHAHFSIPSGEFGGWLETSTITGVYPIVNVQYVLVDA